MARSHQGLLNKVCHYSTTFTLRIRILLTPLHTVVVSLREVFNSSRVFSIPVTKWTSRDLTGSNLYDPSVC